jgi:hypothetical protein
MSFTPQDVGISPGRSILKVIVYDDILNKGEATTDVVVVE